MSHYNKNGGPWSKNAVGGNQGGMQQGMIGAQGMLPFQQQQVFANMGLQQQNMGIGMQQMYNMAPVSYPNTRGLNSAAFQQPMNASGGPGTKERVFTGVVTQVHDNFGFIDDEVFFPRNVCVKGSNPMVGDRVLVEATFNATMPFKWNASRVQVLQPGDNYRDRDQMVENGNDRFGRRDRSKASMGGRGRERDRSRDRDDDEVDRKRRRDDRVRERDREERKAASPARRRSRSPKRRRTTRAVPRYMVHIPKISLNMQKADVFELNRRYTNLYIPSDFFTTQIRWLGSFPAEKPFTLNKPCSFHVMHKELDCVVENDAVLDPEDVDYAFCAKVMLISLPNIEEFYQKTCPFTEDRDKKDRDSEDRDFIHPSRLINFLVGLKGKNETMAIGGPWSPSLDGPDPHKNPMVLIKTAIRTCKALTGVDLSSCTQWYRFVEIYYRRGESTHKGKTIPARVETTVIFLPDVWSCLPTHPEWDGLQQSYRQHFEGIIKANEQYHQPPPEDENVPEPDEKEDSVDEKVEATHYSKLEPKSMTVVDLRKELKARNLSATGIKTQLVAKLNKAIKEEKENDSDTSNNEELNDDEVADMVVVEEEKDDDENKTEPEPPKKLDEKDKQVLERRYTLPASPHLIVHPSKTAKSGRFDCTLMSLSVMLDYRPGDAKEHSFEVSLFAEQFNEMLTRDFGLNIFKAIYEAPEKPKEEKDDKKKREEKKGDDKKKKEDDKKDKSDDKKNKDDEANDEEKMEEDQQESESKKEDVEKRTDKDTTKEKKDEHKKEKDDSKKSDESDNDEEKKDRKEKEKKKDKIKLVTKDRHLLLSFVWFDQTHCGYIFDKDVEDLIHTLGLRLSRAQVKKLISKVISRDSLHYRKLTDKPKEENPSEVVASKEVNLKELLSGNKVLLPIFDDGTEPRRGSKKTNNIASETGVVIYQGAVVDIGKLLIQLERNETSKVDIETRLEVLRTENAKISDKYARSGSNIKHLNTEVKELKEKLKTTEDSLARTNAHSKLFQTTLIDIRDKIDPVLKTASHKEESKRDKEVKKEKDEIKSELQHGLEKDKKGEIVPKKEIKDEHELKSEKQVAEMTETKQEN